MKRRARIDVRIANIPNPEAVIALFKNLVQDTPAEIDVWTNFFLIEKTYVGYEPYESIIKKIVELNLKYEIHESVEFTQSEINKASFLELELNYPWEHSDNYDSKEMGTLYDEIEGRCPECGRGGKQLTDLVIDTRRVGKYNIMYHYPDIIVSEYTKKIIEEAKLTGCEFRDVVQYKAKEQTQKLYQLVVTNVLPKMQQDKMKFEKDRYCDSCGRGQVLRTEIIYSEDSLRNSLDFNHSSEFIGIGAYCTPCVIISSKVRKVFKDNNIKVLRYNPVIIL